MDVAPVSLRQRIGLCILGVSLVAALPTALLFSARALAYLGFAAAAACMVADVVLGVSSRRRQLATPRRPRTRR